MTKLTNIQGADEALPGKVNKVPGDGCSCSAWGAYECCCDADWTDYMAMNKAIDDLSKVEILIDVKELESLIFKQFAIIGSRTLNDKSFTSPSNDLAKSIALKAESFLRLRRING